METTEDINARTEATARPLQPMVRCTLCGAESEDVRHLPLYVIGSEGCEACHDCCMALTGVAKSIMLATSKARKTGYMIAKQIAASKAANVKVSEPATADSTP